MWRYFFKRRLQRHPGGEPISLTEIEQASSVLFAVFARYGDSVIAFKAIAEFVARYPGKKYILITSPQAVPYAEAIIRTPIRLVGINKRRHLLRLWRLIRLLKKENIDLGFNPWSHGLEAEYFASFCRHFFNYRDFAKFERTQNLYQRARRYLSLPDPTPARRPALPDTARTILMCPFSTDVRKGLDRADVRRLIAAVRKRYGHPRIVVAGLAPELERLGDTVVECFELGKSAESSRQFIALLRQANLFIGVDTGPLHVADTFNIPAIGIFGPTAPETILDRNSGVLPLRHANLDGVFCDVQSCRDPVCLHRLSDNLNFAQPVDVDFAKSLHLECKRCAVVVPLGELLNAATREPITQTT